jgi:hypothetical protein
VKYSMLPSASGGALEDSDATLRGRIAYVANLRLNLIASALLVWQKTSP